MSDGSGFKPHQTLKVSQSWGLLCPQAARPSAEMNPQMKYIYKSLPCLQVEIPPKSFEDSSEVRQVSVAMFFKAPSALRPPATDSAGGLVNADLWDPESPGVILKYVLSHKVLILDVLTSHNHCPTVFI